MTDMFAVTAPAARRLFANPSLRRALAWLHLWTGLVFCIPFTALGLSGSVLMLGQALPAQVVENSADGSYRPAAAIIMAAKAVAPDGYAATTYNAPAAPGDMAEVQFRDVSSRVRGLVVRVDPVSLVAKVDPPVAEGFSFMGLMRDVHARMLVSRQVAGGLGVFMCAMGLSGIVLWCQRPVFKTRFGQAPLRVNRELHGAAGVWGLIVFVIVSFSGVTLAFVSVRHHAPSPVTPLADVTPLDIDAAMVLAKEAVDGGVVRTIDLPATPEQPYRVTLLRAGDDTRAPRMTVVIDPWQKNIAEMRDPMRYAARDKFLAWQPALHSGHGLGRLWWVLVFISGFLPTLFTVTGMSMWLLKRRNKRRVREAHLH